MRILGIDPGYGITGYAILDYHNNKYNLVVAGAIETEAFSEFNQRLVDIYNELDNIIKEYKPQRMAIEDLFFNNNIKTGIKVAEARGIMLLAAKQNGLEINEYTPLQVKQGVTGYGRATKTQVKKMTQSILGIKKMPGLDDVNDSIAIAVCDANAGNTKSLLDKYL